MVREAAAEYRTASALEPGNPYFLKQQGFCHYREGNYDEAIHCLEVAFRGDPSDYVVLKTLEKCYEAQGRMKGFLDLLQEALQQHPEQTPLLGTIKKVRKKLIPESPEDS
jgi:tetratricopeptide (TPR) repeat protein